MSRREEVAQAIQEVLGAIAGALGRESGFIRRERAMSGSQLAPMVVCGWWSNPQATLEELAHSGARVGITSSGQRLDQRFTASSAEFRRQVLRVAVQQVIQAERGVEGLLERFSAVYVQDSTLSGLPDRLKEMWAGCGGWVQTNTQAALKIQVQQDLRRGATAGREHALHTTIPVEAFAPGRLRLADVGFSIWITVRSSASEDATDYRC